MRLFRARYLTAAVGALAAVGLLATSNSVFAGSAPPTDKDTVGVYVAATRAFFLRNVNSAGTAALKFKFGPTGSTPLVGDYDNSGSDTIGAFQASTGRFFLRNTNNEGSTGNLVVQYGSVPANGLPLVGDWDGANGDSVGIFDPVKGRFLLRNTNNGGNAQIETRFGRRNLSPAYVALRGNWSGGDSIDGIGLYDPATSTFFLKNDPSTEGPADFTFRFGDGGLGLVPVVGNWDDNDTDTVGLYDPATRYFFIKNTLSDGPPDASFRYGPTGATPIAGNYDNN